MNIANLDWRIWAVAATGVAVLVGVVASRWLSRPRDPDEAERRRRSHLNQVGRIVEGHVVDLMEVAAPPVPPRGFARFARSKPDEAPTNGHRKLVCYSYSISGVSYETAQDVTGLEGHAGLNRIIAGQPASVKYDPANPSNSILVADDWSGL